MATKSFKNIDCKELRQRIKKDERVFGACHIKVYRVCGIIVKVCKENAGRV